MLLAGRHKEVARSVLDVLPDMAWEADASGGAVFANAAYLQFLGWSLSDGLDAQLQAAIHPLDDPWVSECWRRSRQDKQPFECEFRLRAASGEHRWVRARARAMLDEQGALRGWLGLLHDVHEDKIARGALDSPSGNAPFGLAPPGGDPRSRMMQDALERLDGLPPRGAEGGSPPLGGDTPFGLERLDGPPQVGPVDGKALGAPSLDAPGGAGPRSPVAGGALERPSDAAREEPAPGTRSPDGSLKTAPPGGEPCSPQVKPADLKAPGAQVEATGEDVQEQPEILGVKELLRLALSAGGLGVWELDVLAGTLRVDERARETLGLPALLNPAGAGLARIHVDDQPRVLAQLATAKREASSVWPEVEYRVVAGPGVARHVHTRGRVFFENGVAARLVGVTHEVSSEYAAGLGEARRLEHLQLALESANLGTWVLNVAGGRVLLGEHAQRILGLSAPEAKLTALFEAVDPAERARVQANLDAALGGENDGRLDVTTTVTRPDGTTRRLHATARPLLEGGAQVGLVGVLADETERLAAEERFSRLAEGNMVGIVTARDDGSFSYANDYYLNVIGATREDLSAGRINWASITSPEDRALDLKAIDEMNATGVAVPYRKHYILPGGRVVPILTAPVRMASGEIVAVVLDLTQSEAAERAVRESEARYRALSEASGQVIWTLGPDGAAVEPPAAWCELTGQTPRAALGWGWLRAIHPEDRELTRAAWAHAAAARAPHRVTQRVLRHDGEYRVMHQQAIPVFEGGELREWIVAHEDRTTATRVEVERERLLAAERVASTQAQESLALLEGLLDYSPLGIAFLDLDLRFQRINGALAAMNGLSADEHLGRTIAELLPELNDQSRQVLEQILRTGQAMKDVIISGETPARPGEAREWREAFYPVRAAGGEIIGLGVIAEDVTDVRHAQEQLADQARRLADQASLIALANEVVITRDPQSRVIEWNSAAEALYGFTAAEALGRELHVLLKARFPESREAANAALFEAGYWEGELTHTRANGREVSVMSRQALERDESGRPHRILEVNWDITARVQAEAQAREVNDTLAARVEERTRELSERNAEQESWIYTASHDLRTPLVSIQGMSSILQEAADAEDWVEARFAAQRVGVNAARMGDLLDGLLEVSRISRLADPAARLNLGEATQEALKGLEQRDRLTWTLPSDWPEIHFPRNQAMQALRHVYANAIKFARTLANVSWSERDAWITLSVDDDGPGVPEAQREWVFELFRQLDANTPGTGTGLPIVKRIIERYGGRATIGESLQGGACVTLQFPKARED